MRAWRPSTCSSARNRGSCWTRRTEIAIGRPAVLDCIGVVADLHVDGVEVGRHRVEFCADALAMSAQQREPLVLIAVARTDQLRVMANLADRHPGRPQLGDQLDPAEVALGIT